MIEHVIMPGGVSIDWDVAQRLMAIEDRGGSFVVEHGRISVEPTGVLTSDDRAYLVARKPEVLKILSYDASKYASEGATMSNPNTPGTTPAPSSPTPSPGTKPVTPTTPTHPTPTAPTTPSTPSTPPSTTPNPGA